MTVLEQSVPGKPKTASFESMIPVCECRHDNEVGTNAVKGC